MVMKVNIRGILRPKKVQSKVAHARKTQKHLFTLSLISMHVNEGNT